MVNLGMDPIAGGLSGMAGQVVQLLLTGFRRPWLGVTQNEHVQNKNEFHVFFGKICSGYSFELLTSEIRKNCEPSK